MIRTTVEIDRQSVGDNEDRAFEETIAKWNASRPTDPPLPSETKAQRRRSMAAIFNHHVQSQWVSYAKGEAQEFMDGFQLLDRLRRASAEQRAAVLEALPPIEP